MARPRSFEEEEVLQCAMQTFWRMGYDATTYKVLEDLTGVGVRSMHNTFGEKEVLFARSLDAYRKMKQDMITRLFNPPNREAIVRYFETAVTPQPEDDIARAGCLIANTVVEINDLPDIIAARVNAYREMWKSTYRTALESSGVGSVNDRAEFLVGALWGLMSQIRMDRDTTAAAPMARVVVETVESW